MKLSLQGSVVNVSDVAHGPLVHTFSKIKIHVISTTLVYVQLICKTTATYVENCRRSYLHNTDNLLAAARSLFTISIVGFFHWKPCLKMALLSLCYYEWHFIKRNIHWYDVLSNEEFLIFVKFIYILTNDSFKLLDKYWI